MHSVLVILQGLSSQLRRGSLRFGVGDECIYASSIDQLGILHTFCPPASCIRASPDSQRVMAEVVLAHVEANQAVLYGGRPFGPRRFRVSAFACGLRNMRRDTKS